MRARHPETVGRLACPRCAGLLVTGQPVCALCGFGPGRPPEGGPPTHSVRRAVVVDDEAGTATAQAGVAVMVRDEPLPPFQPAPAVDLSPEVEAPAHTALDAGPARWVTVLAVVVGVLALIRTLVSGWLLPAAASTEVAATTSTVLGIALVASVVVMTVVFLRWVRHARLVAEAESTFPQRWSPRASVLGWLVPVAGIFIGWQVLQDLWGASDPVTSRDPEARRPEPVLLTCWFAALAVSSVVWLAGAVVLGGAPLVDVVSAVALATSGLCLGRVVKQISRWQQTGSTT